MQAAIVHAIPPSRKGATIINANAKMANMVFTFFV